MSKIQELINELCPDGVEFKPLWQVTIWDKKFKEVDRKKQSKTISYPHILAGDIDQYEDMNGDVRILTTGISDNVFWTTEEKVGSKLCEGEVVAIPGGGTPNVKYYKGKFVTADNRIATSVDIMVLNNKFLYYWLIYNLKTLEGFYRGGGIKHPEMQNVLNLLIPVPPIEVQNEIIRILDAFTSLVSELQAELQARKEQYEYYRNKLLSFDGRQDVEWKTLGEIGKICMCKRIMKQQTDAAGDIPFYKIGTFGEKADAYISRDLYNEYKQKFSFPRKGEILLSASGTIGRAVIYDGQDAYYQDSNIVWLRNDEDKVLNKYLYYYYQIVEWYVEGGTIKRLYNSNLAKTKIAIPPLSEQERIVGILDKFEALVNSRSEGLPAEIEGVQRQYEYYRNKLLRFKQLA